MSNHKNQSPSATFRLPQLLVGIALIVAVACPVGASESRVHFRDTAPGTTSPTDPAPTGWTDITGANTGNPPISIPAGGSIYFAVINIDNIPIKSSKSITIKFLWHTPNKSKFTVPTATGVTGQTAKAGYVSSLNSKTSVSASFNKATGWDKCPEWEYITFTNKSNVTQTIQISPTVTKTECSCKTKSSTGGTTDDTLTFAEGSFGVPGQMTAPLRVTEIQIYPEMVEMDLVSPAPFFAAPHTGNWISSVPFVDPEGTPRPSGGAQWNSDGFGLLETDLYEFSFSMLGGVDDSYIMFIYDADAFEYTKFRVSLPDPPWYEDFDDYDPGSSLHGGSGWKGWDNDPAFDAPLTDEQFHSAEHSLKVELDTDILRVFEGDDDGLWSFECWQYIPADFVSVGGGEFAGSYFNILNTYNDAGPYEWSVQMQFDSNDGMCKVFHGDGIDRISVPYDTDRWVKIQAVIDLDKDWTRIYYDDNLITEYSWVGGVLGDGGGASDIAIVDLFANGSSSVYYDDFKLVPLERCEPDVTTQGAAEGDPAYGKPDGIVTGADINYYVNFWVEGNVAEADVTTQGAAEGDPNFGVPDGIVTAADINYYVNLWISGCF